MEDKEIKKRCPKCNSLLIYIRGNENKEIVCRSCGNISKLNIDEEEENGEGL